MLADDDQMVKLRAFASELIVLHQAKLDALKQELSRGDNNGSSDSNGDLESEDEDQIRLADAIRRILVTAGKPLGKKEIMKRYEMVYKKKASENSIGGALFKNKGTLFEKIGDKGTRYAKWKLMPEVK